jgi:HSP20 family protein
MAERKDEDEAGPLEKLQALASGFGSLLEKLQELADHGGARVTGGTFTAGPEKEGQSPLKGIFGLSVKLGLGDRELKIEPFGNLRRNQASGESVVEEVREPLVDVFDEGGQVLILAEMPGVEAGDIHVEVEGGRLTLSAQRGERRYRKEMEVPPDVEREAIAISCQNGIVELRMPRRPGQRPRDAG